MDRQALFEALEPGDSVWLGIDRYYGFTLMPVGTELRCLEKEKLSAFGYEKDYWKVRVAKFNFTLLVSISEIVFAEEEVVCV